MTALRGATDILRYNARFYALSAGAAVLAAVASSQPLPPSLRLALLAFAGLTLLLMTTSLLAAHHVYDRSPLRGWAWLAPRLPRPPASWVVVHAGLDEASGDLRRLFPRATGLALDIHDPREMTEPGIARARALRAPARGDGLARAAALPLAPRSVELLVLFLSAHELRRPASREALFAELARALAPGGTLLLVEHLRDLPNLLAFGPGAFHFHARREWLRLAERAALRVREEAPITPFVRAFFLQAGA